MAKLQTDLREFIVLLNSHSVEYILVGGHAVAFHGYPRFTEDIDLILTREGIDRFHAELVGLEYVPAFSGSRKRLKSTRDDSPIELIAAGEYPGDGQPKPVAFPDPADTSIEIDGVKFPTLEKLIELKLASGMTAPDRLKDLADVQEIIKILNLSSLFAEKLNPYVRDKFVELLKSVEHRNSNFQEQS